MGEETASDPPDPPSTQESGELPGEAPRRIGSYLLLRRIGEGGMGEVWLADQTEPVRRRVAVKIIRPGMDTRQVVARFEAERQALALMDHPCVAKVFDAGSTPEGRPYFVMEHVPGVPITEYCDTHRLTIPERLQLFVKVCEGAQHAHQKAIIHRDLKPTNVLVAETDGRPAPKIIDFGVAKATARRLTEKTLFTELGVMIGTPEYMSPEQAELTGEDVDTRTDVYSLGVMLYELLVGALPFNPSELRSEGYEGVRRRIRNEEPKRPSTRLITLGSGSVESARRRRADLPTLTRQLRGELDWITMKAIEKDRSRRYGSPSELAADIGRHLEHLPVLAGPPSTAYRTRKFVRRHLLAVCSGAVIFLLLAAFAATMSLQARRLAAERDRAERALEDLRSVADFQARMLSGVDPGETGRNLIADLRRRIAEALESGDATRAETERALASFDGALARISPTDVALRLIDREILTRATGAITTQFGDRPLIEARLRDTIGETYGKLGLYPQAEENLTAALAIRRRLLGEEDPDTLRSVEHVADLYSMQGRYPQAEALAVPNLEARRRILGEDAPETFISANGLAMIYARTGRLDEAGKLYERTLEVERRVLGEENPETLATMNNLGVLYKDQGRYEAAEQMLRRTLELRRRVLGIERSPTASTMNNLATLYATLGRYQEAESQFTELLAIQKRLLGEEHPDTLSVMNNLGLVYASESRLDEAEALHLRTLALRRRVLGPEHPDTLVSMNNLSNDYVAQGRFADALRLDTETLAARRRLLGPEHPDTLVSMGNLGLLYMKMGRTREAESLLLECLDLRRRVSGPSHPGTMRVRRHLIDLYRSEGREEELRRLLTESLDASRSVAEGENASAAELNDCAWQLLTIEIEDLRDPRAAVGFARRACALEEAAGGPDLWNYLDTLALAQFDSGDAAGAIESEKKAIALLPADSPDRAGLQKQLAGFEDAPR